MVSNISCEIHPLQLRSTFSGTCLGSEVRVSEREGRKWGDVEKIRGKAEAGFWAWPASLGGHVTRKLDAKRGTDTFDM